MMETDLSVSQPCEARLDHRLKFAPASADGALLEDCGRESWNVLREDLMFPVAVLKDAALAHNSAWMRAFTAKNGVSLCPHGKTTMSPQLIARQLADGAWGITAATAAHVRTYRVAGVSRIILANQLVGRQNIDYVLSELARDPAFEFYCLVDSVDGLELLLEPLRQVALGRPLRLLLEVGFAGGRTGTRTLDEALTLAQAIAAAAPLVELHGVEGFEGSLAGREMETLEVRVASHLQSVVEAARVLDERGLFGSDRILLTAGGSAFFDLVVEAFADVQLTAPVEAILRSGCYLTHDNCNYESFLTRLIARSPSRVPSGPGPVPALEVWAPVQSVPEPGRMIVAMGKRDLSHDIDLPQLVAWCPRGEATARPPHSPDYRVFALNDQHAYVARPEGCTMRVGDLVGFGISHPCTTFDKWRALLVVDDAYNVTGAVETVF